MTDLDEIEAMRKIAEALEPLEDAARLRALQWAASRYRGGKSLAIVNTPASSDLIAGGSEELREYPSFAELFAATNPEMEKEKALVAAYWVQVCQHLDSFPAQTLNTELRDLGHRVSNITDALTQLKVERPALILQLKKSGTTRQARKTYKLTQEGIKRVHQMLALRVNESQ